MRFRLADGTLLFFDRKTGDSGIISGIDYENVLNWVKYGKLSTTIALLISKYSICEADKERIAALQCIYPLFSNAFAVPESLHIELTARCGLNCVQCYKKNSEKYIDYGRLKKIIDEAAQIGVFQIAFGGGEPLLYPYLENAIVLASHYDMGTSITSSGLRLNAEKLERLIQAGLNYIQISLNGTSEEINKKSRNGFEISTNALELLSKSSMSFGVNTVISKLNIDDIENMIIYAKQLHAKNLNLLRYKPTSKNEMAKIELDLTDYHLLAELIKKYNSQDFSIKVDSAFGSLIAHIHKANLDNNYTGCTAGRRFMAVDCEGNYKVCSHMIESETMESILDFWQNGKLVTDIRATEAKIGEPCRSCCYISNCRGCRAICYNKYGDSFDGEKDCFVFRRMQNDTHI